MKEFLKRFLLILACSTISGCGKNTDHSPSSGNSNHTLRMEPVPDCSAEHNRDSAIEILKKEAEQEFNRFYLKPKFEYIHTDSKGEDAASCSASIALFHEPPLEGLVGSVKVQYTIRRDELKKGVFIFELAYPHADVMKMNTSSRIARQDYFYNKLDLGVLTSAFYANIQSKAREAGDQASRNVGNSMFALAKNLNEIQEMVNDVESARILTEHYDFDKVTGKLYLDGWSQIKEEELIKEGWIKSTADTSAPYYAYRKEKFTLMFTLREITVRGAGWNGADVKKKIINPNATFLFDTF